jgi:hypothetical protein
MKTETPQIESIARITPRRPFSLTRWNWTSSSTAAKCWSAASSACGAIRPPRRDRPCNSTATGSKRLSLAINGTPLGEDGYTLQ